MGLSDFNPLSLVSNVVQSISHEILPKNLQFLGDIAAIGLDYQSGNWLGGLGDLQKLLTDLPQTAAGLDSALGSGHGSSDPQTAHPLEPTPPPQYGISSLIGHRAASLVRGTPPATPATVATTTASPPASTTSTSSTSPATPAPSTSTVSADAFFQQSDADLMNKVASGQVPDSITKDPAKMQQLQARMNRISEMNQLISQMLAAIHDMHKQVIQNIRA